MGEAVPLTKHLCDIIRRSVVRDVKSKQGGVKSHLPDLKLPNEAVTSPEGGEFNCN